MEKRVDGQKREADRATTTTQIRNIRGSWKWSSSVYYHSAPLRTHFPATISSTLIKTADSRKRDKNRGKRRKRERRRKNVMGEYFAGDGELADGDRIVRERRGFLFLLPTSAFHPRVIARTISNFIHDRSRKRTTNISIRCYLSAFRNFVDVERIERTGGTFDNTSVR